MLAYKEGNSLFHQMDPITKFVWISLVSLWLMSLRDLPSIVTVSAGALAISILGARIPLGSYLKIVLMLCFGGISLVLFQGLFRPGPGITVSFLHFSYEGMGFGLTLTIRTFGLVAVSLAFSGTTRPKDFALSLIKIGMSYRMAHVAYLGLRFLPVLEADVRIINDAQKLRGVKPGWGKIKRTLIAMVATELRRAEEVAIALDTRAFGLYDQQTQLEQIMISKIGMALLAGTTVMLISHIIILWLRP